MNITENAESTARAVCALLEVEPDADHFERVRRIVERSIINAVLDEAERHTHVVLTCCSADLDTAHKINDEIRRANDALVANLSSLR